MESCRDNGYEQHSGFQIVKRSTLAYVNEHRNYEVYEDVYYALYRLYAPLLGGRLSSKKFGKPVYSVDSTTITLCLSAYKWAHYSRSKGAIKLHTMLNNDSLLPEVIVATDGKVADITAARDLMKFPVGSIVVMDRGYNDYKLFAACADGYCPQALQADVLRSNRAQSGLDMGHHVSARESVHRRILDVYSRMVVHFNVYDRDCAEYAQEFLDEAMQLHGITPGKLVVHSDNGASMKASSTLALLETRGVTFSHSRPRVSNDNPYSESLFRTLKYCGSYRYPAGGFEGLTAAREWLAGFVNHYNEDHRHRGIRMVTPGQRLRGEDVEILRRRKETMKKAQSAHPERWISPQLLNCEPVGTVWLNPDNGMLEEQKCAALT